MKVWLTIQNEAGQKARPALYEYVEGDGDSYPEAYAAAVAAVEEGWSVLAIRTSEHSGDPRLQQPS